MIRTLQRSARVYGAVTALTPKLFLAYRMWVWTEFIAQIFTMTILVFFWRAVYASRGGAIGGLDERQTIDYILIAQTLMPLVENRLIFQFGWMLREGQIAIDLLRPLDMQTRFYLDSLTSLAIYIALKVPLILFALLAFGLRLPSDPAIWLVFLITLVLGHAVLFFFDWFFACLAFYTTETWGLSVIRVAVGTFFSGALMPLSILPGWLLTVANALPFAQAIYVPVSFLSGINAPARAPGIWFIQFVWLVGLMLASRLFFRVAVRKVTVQGG